MKRLARSVVRSLFVASLLLASVASTPMLRPASGAGNDHPAAVQDAGLGEVPTAQIIVKYKASADVGGFNAPAGDVRMQALSAVAGVQLQYFREMSGDAHVLRLPEALPVADVQRIAGRLMALPDVEYAEPDRILQPLLTPNDLSYPSQWHYFETYGINAPGAWDITTGSSSIVVAVIDTGYLDHADLSGRFVPGYDFITNVAVANDGNGRDSDAHDPGDWIAFSECAPGSPARNSTWHGTHVAGTIGAASNNSLGVAGVNWTSKILPVRVLGKCGGIMSDIADAMRWAAGLPVSGVPANANPAKVLNLSLGGTPACGSTEQNAINDVIAAGATVVVAAGNNNANAAGYSPASCNGVITVAATDRGGDKASYSNYGSVVEIAAPGGETAVSTNGVLSTLNTGTSVPVADTYTYYQGTSMATPHVVGVASLLYSLSPSLTPSQVGRILTGTITAFPGGSGCTTAICGTGIVNAATAVGAMPRITGLNPNVVTATGGSFTLFVNGANFNAGSTVKWNGSSRTTGFVSGNQLTATILAGDIALPGTYSVTVSVNHATYGTIDTTAQTVSAFSSVKRIYLPAIMKNYASTPLIPLQNGDFESGRTVWTEFSSGGFPLIINSGFPTGVAPHGGSWAAWLGGAPNETSYIQQSVTVPPGSSTLSYWHWAASAETECTFDFAFVRVNGSTVDTFGLCSSTNTGGWVKRTIDLAAYAGQTVQLQFRAETDFSVNSNWFIDDVAFGSSGMTFDQVERPLPADSSRQPLGEDPRP